MTTTHKQPKTPDSAAVTDSAPNKTGATGHQSAGFDKIFSIPDKVLNSAFAQGSVNTNTKTMTLSLTNCNLVRFGQSSPAHHSDSHLLRKSQEEADLSRLDCYVEQVRPMKEEESSIVQCFGGSGVFVEKSRQEPVTGEILDIEPSLPVIRKQGFLNGPQCEKILKTLERLRDNGKFEDHQRMVNFFLPQCLEKGSEDMEAKKQQIPNGHHCDQVPEKFHLFQEKGRLKEDDLLYSLYSRLYLKEEFADMELTLLIEQGESFMYNKQTSKSKRYFTAAIELAEHCKLRNPNILIARAYFLLGRNSSCRNPRKIGTFLNYLTRSEALLQNHESPEDWAQLCHFLGTFWLAYMSKLPIDDRNAKSRKKWKNKAKTYYERAIAICTKDPHSRAQHKKLTYCHLSLTALLLDCSSIVARAGIKVIPTQDLKDAKRHLDIVEYKLGENITQSTRVQILKRRSDLHYRQGPEMFELAKETAQDAFQMARSHGFNTELKSLQERIDFLDQLCQNAVCRERTELLVDGDSSSSGSDSRFGSCSEPDENQILL